ncbi:MAG: preprotein translocase subunit SecD [Chlorobi bacterium OLB4]|nr:MAG: preprotein translocase subunit SecD [Chlorobi bacterium OLB4]MBW7856145.1 protein translocase subunit SecD [Ignavibacteria bacterium]OQY78041.1 MAG: protein translocase subunit SecD [Ignavibacteriales bacterium UTCHB1]
MKKNLSRIILTVALLILTVYFLYPTYQDYQLNQTLNSLSGEDSVRYVEENAAFIKDVTEKRLKLGLDLKGGVYVVLDVDVVKFLSDLAGDRNDDKLKSILEQIRAETVDSDESILELLKQKLNAEGLTLKSYYGEIRDSEEDIEKKLETEIEGAIDRAVEVVRNRVDQYGVAEPQIQKVGGEKIIVELPGVSNPQEVRKLLQGTALLEFRMVIEPERAVKIMQDINKVLAGLSAGENENLLDSIVKSGDTTVTEDKETDTTLTENKETEKTTSNKKSDTTSNKKSDTTTSNESDTSEKGTDSNVSDDTTQQLSQEEFIKQNPLFFTIAIVNFESGIADAYVKETDKAKVERLLEKEEVKKVIPDDVSFVWSQKSFQGQGGETYYVLYTIKSEPELTGNVIVDANSNIDPTTNQPIVTMQMNSEGAADWARITGSNINKRCAIVLDNVVYSAPNIKSKITGGNSQIEGMANVQEAKLLEIVLKAGALPAPLKIIEERTIGPSLGEDSIRAGIVSSIASLILVALFMIVYYRTAGAVADFALVINVLFVIGIMASFKATLTLPGIAGLILTLGMAVDTNVLINERVREETKAGKPLKTAIEIGYKKAFSAIIDSHVTSVITGIILYQFGTGPIQGFALILLFGIVVNLFTAIVITHFIFDIFLERGKKVSFG